MFALALAGDPEQPDDAPVGQRASMAEPPGGAAEGVRWCASGVSSRSARRRRSPPPSWHRRRALLRPHATTTGREAPRGSCPTAVDPVDQWPSVAMNRRPSSPTTATQANSPRTPTRARSATGSAVNEPQVQQVGCASTSRSSSASSLRKPGISGLLVEQPPRRCVGFAITQRESRQGPVDRGQWLAVLGPLRFRPMVALGPSSQFLAGAR